MKTEIKMSISQSLHQNYHPIFLIGCLQAAVIFRIAQYFNSDFINLNNTDIYITLNN
jgi:hypothetical protein